MIGYFVDGPGVLTTSDSEPEPDILVVRGAFEDYADRHAGPDEVPLIAEVADVSLDRDRGLKQRVYARAKVPVYWVVNVRDRVVEVLTEPSGPIALPKYNRLDTYREGAEIPIMIDNKDVGTIAVGAIFAKGADSPV